MYSNYQLTIIILSSIIFFMSCSVICVAFYKYRNVNLLKIDIINDTDDELITL